MQRRLLNWVCGSSVTLAIRSSKGLATNANSVQVRLPFMYYVFERYMLNNMCIISHMQDYSLCYTCLTNGNFQEHDPTHTYQEVCGLGAEAQSTPVLPVSENNWVPGNPRWQTIPATKNSPEIMVIPKIDVPAAMRLIASCTFCKQLITRDRYVRHSFSCLIRKWHCQHIFY